MMHIKKDFSGITREGQKKLFIIEGHANIIYIRAKFHCNWRRYPNSPEYDNAAVSEYEPVLFLRILGW
jgi:hypothetical protein